MYILVIKSYNNFYFELEMPVQSDKGPFKCYVTQMVVGGVQFSRKKRYKGVTFNVILALRGGGWGYNFQEKSVT